MDILIQFFLGILICCLIDIFYAKVINKKSWKESLTITNAISAIIISFCAVKNVNLVTVIISLVVIAIIGSKFETKINKGKDET